MIIKKQFWAIIACTALCSWIVLVCTYAGELNTFRSSPAYEIIEAKAELYYNADPVKRNEAFQYFYHLNRFLRDMHLKMIDRRIDDSKEISKLDELQEKNPFKAYAIIMQSNNHPYQSNINYLLKNIEYQAKDINTLTTQELYRPDFTYPTYVCVPILVRFSGNTTEPIVKYLASTPIDHITEKQIELMAYLLHKQYGSGQSAIRIITVLAEESTKRPHNPNVVRLIDYMGNKYKP